VPAIDVVGLRRVFPAGRREAPTIALDGLDLSVGHGETFGLLGPNAAGKTTLVKILATVLLPTAGTARVLGHDVAREADAVRPIIGLVLGGDRGLYGRLSARDNLLFWAALYRIERREALRRSAELLDRFGLAERADERVEQFSRGMKQRLHLARGLIHQPPVLFLDEPTVGLDPTAAREVRALVAALKADGRTILLATHDMDEAAELCDRVSFIDRGAVRAVERTETIGRLLSGHDRIDFTTSATAVVQALRGLPGVESVDELADSRYRTHLTATDDHRRYLLRWLVDQGVVELQTSKPSLEEVYLHVLGDRGMMI
jgi:ABC-2 type transport system ATP-binding protein